MKEVVSPSDVLHLNAKTGKWYFAGRELSKQELANFSAEAKIIVNTALWKLLVNEGKYHAQKRAMIDSNTGNDTEDLATLRSAQAYHKVVVMFQDFMSKFTN